MAQLEPLRALHYDPAKTGGLQDVVAPPYDVIEPAQRDALERRSPYNVVRIDLPRGERPYESAARELARWRELGVIVRDEAPALWVLQQDYTGPDGRRRSRRGFIGRVRIDEYGAGRIRPHERTHPGPREDRLQLTRATGANLSPVFSLYSDPDGVAAAALDPTTAAVPWARITDDDGTVTSLWRAGDQAAIAAAQRALDPAELLIADGHHRYETARVYAEEIGGEGEHRYVLMCLVSLQDPGLTVFPTHRLLRRLRPAQRDALAAAVERYFDAAELEDPAAVAQDWAPVEGRAPVPPIRLGYIAAGARAPSMLTLRDRRAADAALAGHSEPYRRLDTAVLEALILRSALGMTDEDIDRLQQLGYARDAEQALAQVRSGACDAAFLMAPIPIEQVQAVAAAGETMPPKSTYFYPKVPTGLVFNPLR